MRRTGLPLHDGDVRGAGSGALRDGATSGFCHSAGESDCGRSRFRRIDPQAGDRHEPQRVPACGHWRCCRRHHDASRNLDCAVRSLSRRSERVQWGLLQRLRTVPSHRQSQPEMRFGLPQGVDVHAGGVRLSGRQPGLWAGKWSRVLRGGCGLRQRGLCLPTGFRRRVQGGSKQWAGSCPLLFRM